MQGSVNVGATSLAEPTFVDVLNDLHTQATSVLWYAEGGTANGLAIDDAKMDVRGSLHWGPDMQLVGEGPRTQTYRGEGESEGFWATVTFVPHQERQAEEGNVLVRVVVTAPPTTSTSSSPT
jgi:hypothetical protein